MTKTTNNATSEAAKLELELQSYMGDLVRYRHPLNRTVIYTPGVRHLAEAGQAFWLLNAIASWIGTDAFLEGKRKDPRIGDMHFWKLNVNREDGTAVLHAEADCDVEPFIVQSIPFTDFPLDKIEIWAGFDGEHWTLYLPSEH